jgi:dynactin complex subunit
MGSYNSLTILNKVQMLLKCNIHVLGYWYGIELEKPHGKNDGSVGGVQYFSCSPRYGIFAPPSRVQR